ncbi:MAG: DUF6088 family protein [Lacunisphaera sp.]
MTLSAKISRRLSRWPLERVFSRLDFLDLGPTAAVGMTLKRMQDAGTIRRVKRGYYDRPRSDPVMGQLGVSPKEFMAAVARRTGQRLQPHESTTANELGLTEQVPAQTIYATDGASREIDLGKRRPIRLQKRPLRELALAAEVSRFVFSGMRAIGKAQLTRARVRHLRKELKPGHRRQLLRDLRYAPAWMHPLLRYIAGDEKAAP